MNPDCPNRAKCGPTGHILDPNTKKYTRCACLQQRVNKVKLGLMYSPEPILSTPLASQAETDLLIPGPLNPLKPHLAGAMLKLEEARKTWVAMDAYRLIEIFLGTDGEETSNAFAVDADLLVLMLGFADPPNRYLPELVLQVLNRRQMLSQATWVILGIDLEHVATKYNSALKDYLRAMKVVRIA